MNIEEFWKTIPAKAMRTLLWILVFIGNSVLILLSIYTTWGWLTIVDIRAKCEKHGVNFDQVIESFISEGPNTNLKVETNGDTHVEITWKPGAFPGFRRYALSFSTADISLHSEVKTSRTNNVVNSSEIHEPSIWTFDGGLIEPFAALTDNVVNCIFCAGLAYLMSCSVMVVRSFRKAALTPRYVFWRPIAGALWAVCFFLMVMSGGKLLWEKGATMNNAALGVIAAFAAVSCERADLWLKKRFSPISESGE